MIGKVISGSSFSGTVGYVMKEESRILEAEGVMPPEVKDMAQDFKDQTLLNPRLKNNVGHISLSFSSKDAPRMTDALMTQIAKEYMQKMGITDTQYLLVRHLDQPHPHCHLVYNRVGNNGQTISDKNIKIRNAKVCRELTGKYGLYPAPGKTTCGGSGYANRTKPDTQSTMRSNWTANYGNRVSASAINIAEILT